MADGLMAPRLWHTAGTTLPVEWRAVPAVRAVRAPWCCGGEWRRVAARQGGGQGGEGQSHSERASSLLLAVCPAPPLPPELVAEGRGRRSTQHQLLLYDAVATALCAFARIESRIPLSLSTNPRHRHFVTVPSPCPPSRSLRLRLCRLSPLSRLSLSPSSFNSFQPLPFFRLSQTADC
jgi:hypothetical protein